VQSPALHGTAACRLLTVTGLTGIAYTLSWIAGVSIPADLLRARLQQEPGRAVRLHRNAAAWHEEHGLADEAIRHAVAAGEMTWAARLIERYFDAVYRLRGEPATIQRWISALPAGLLQSRPRLLLAQAQLAAAASRMEAVQRFADAAERAFAAAADEPFEPSVGRATSLLANIPAHIALCRGFAAQYRGDAEATAAFASRARAELGEDEHLLDYEAHCDLAVAELAPRPARRGGTGPGAQHRRVGRPAHFPGLGPSPPRPGPARPGAPGRGRPDLPAGPGSYRRTRPDAATPASRGTWYWPASCLPRTSPAGRSRCWTGCTPRRWARNGPAASSRRAPCAPWRSRPAAGRTKR